MGSVIFSTIGQAVAGPLGGAAAAMAGSALDAALAGRGRRGRVPEFRAPTSAYGDPVPEVYGVSRVSGVLIWALPFARSGEAKGGTSDRSAYTASFAIAVSSRRIARIGRIWADGRLIRDADGTLGIACTMRVHRGVAEQALDPLIAAAEGPGTCPAYRQLAHVVFEDFPLAAFGNRIPALSFEVHADQEGSAAADWLAEHLGRSGLGGARCIAAAGLGGYAALGPTAREDAEALSDFLAVRPVLDRDGVRIERLGREWNIPEEELGARRPADDPDAGPRPTTAALADRVSGARVGYLDPERDFQRGAQHYGERAGARVLDVSGPFSARAAEALRSARTLFLDARAAIERLELALSWEWLGIAPNDRLRLAGDHRLWRVVEKLVEAGLVRLRCEAVSEHGEANLPGDHGRVLPAPADRLVPTRLALVEAPTGWSGEEPPALRIFALAADGWTSANLGWAAAGEDMFAPLGALRVGMANGSLLEPLGEAPSTLWDEANRLVIGCDAGDERILSRSMRAVLDGASLLCVGDELIQFRSASVLGEGRLILSGLLRGRLGTTPRLHLAGTPWHEVVFWAAQGLALRPDWAGRTLLFQASGAGDPAGGTLREHGVTGAATAPLGPCHLRILPSGPDRLALAWTGRDRACLDWNGAAEAPERWYRVQLRWTGATGQRTLALPVFGEEVVLPEEAVAEARTAGSGQLWCEVIAEGDGPVTVRSSGERMLAV